MTGGCRQVGVRLCFQTGQEQVTVQEQIAPSCIRRGSDWVLGKISSWERLVGHWDWLHREVVESLFTGIQRTYKCATCGHGLVKDFTAGFNDLEGLFQAKWSWDSNNILKMYVKGKNKYRQLTATFDYN